jgi:hypothetical protein
MSKILSLLPNRTVTRASRVLLVSYKGYRRIRSRIRIGVKLTVRVTVTVTVTVTIRLGLLCLRLGSVCSN